MTSYTNNYGGSPVQPADVSYNALTISADTTLAWPVFAENTDDVASRIIRVTATIPGLTLSMPPANQVSDGMDVLIVNVGSETFSVGDNSGNTIVSSASGNAHYIYVVDNTTVDGSWAVVLFGASAASINASALAGQGLKAIAATLNVNSPVTTINASYTLGTGDRANTIVSTGGAITIDTVNPSTLGNGWITYLRNSGSGNITFDPFSGTTIDGAATATLAPTESMIIMTDGSNFYSVGKTTTASTAFTRLSKSIAGSSNVTLTAAEAAYSIISFTGTLTGNFDVITPTNVRIWTIENNTNGAYTVTYKTLAGTGITLGASASDINQGEVNPCYCDGTNVRIGFTAGVGTLTQIDTGTGLTGGPITGTGTVAIANTTVSAGTYGAADTVPVIDFNAQGQATAATDTLIQIDGSQIDPGTIPLAQLASQANSTIVSNVSGSSAVPSANTITAVLDYLLGSTQGTVAYRGASSWAGLAPGTAYKPLITQGAAANPTWNGKVIAQRLSSENDVYTALTTNIPYDNSLPQISEGDQIFSTVITPQNASSTLVIEAVVYMSDNGGGRPAIALFKNSDVNAISAAGGSVQNPNTLTTIVLKNDFTSGTTSAITYSLRAGTTSGTAYLNGNSSGRIYGGALKCSFVITEILP